MFEGDGGILNDIIRKKKGETGSFGVIRFMCIQVCVPISALSNVILRTLCLNIEATEISI